MAIFNQLLNNKSNIFDKLSLLFFSVLPISMIIGNASININMLLIDVLFVVYCFRHNLWHWVKEDVFLCLAALYIFLNLNSLYSHFILFDNQVNAEGDTLKFYNNDSIIRSFLFIKFILLVFAFKILLKDNKILNLVHKSWLFIISIVILDIFFEKFTGKNIIGNISPDKTRIVSFFKDELVVGAFIFCFGYTSTTYLINNKIIDKKVLPIILILLMIPLSIFITGEKSNFIRSILLFFVIIYFFKKNKFYFNYKILLLAIFFLISCFVIFSDITREKYYQTYKRIIHKSEVQKESGLRSTIWDNFQSIKYFAHYDTAINIFKNYPITGVGNKNFRIECSKKEYFNENIYFTQSRCSTHPHQIHFEILSENGILGYFLILGSIIWFTFTNIKASIRNPDIYHLSNNAYILIFFIPLLPGGGIFSTFNGSLFWVIFSLANLNYEKK